MTHSYVAAQQLANEYLARESRADDGRDPAFSDAEYLDLFARVTNMDDGPFNACLEAIHAQSGQLHSRQEVSNAELASLLSAGLRREDPFDGPIGPDRALFLASLAFEAIRRFVTDAAPGVHHCLTCMREGKHFGCIHEPGGGLPDLGYTPRQLPAQLPAPVVE